jgi:hypothetical protein
MKSDARAKIIERAIRLAFSSLESHLYWTHKKTTEGKTFHKTAAKEYAEIISILSQLY